LLARISDYALNDSVDRILAENAIAFPSVCRTSRGKQDGCPKEAAVLVMPERVGPLLAAGRSWRL
jgi:hypothetical protein